MPREFISMSCSDCKSRNYVSTKNKKQGAARLELRRFCPKCGKHVVHKESK
jgi:large subunit ribosomal protein L33